MAVEINQKIVKQIEYYFGNINLPKDRFLQEQIQEDNGWIPLATMLNFHRLALISTDIEQISNAIKNSKSDVIEISEDGLKIRRNSENPVPEDLRNYKQSISDRSVIVKGFPIDTQLNDIVDWANQFGDTEHVHMRRTKAEGKPFKGSVSITFKTKELAEKAQKSDAKFGDFELTKTMLEEYWAQVKKKEAEQKETKKAVRAEKRRLAEAGFEEARFKHGLILRVDGLGKQTTARSIKKFFKQFGDSRYVEHYTGNTTACIHFFNATGGAGMAWQKALEASETSGKVVIDGQEITGRVLEGEEEAKQYQAELSARKKRTTTEKIPKKRTKITGPFSQSMYWKTCGDALRHARYIKDAPKPKHIVFEDSD